MVMMQKIGENNNNNGYNNNDNNGNNNNAKNLAKIIIMAKSWRK